MNRYRIIEVDRRWPDRESIEEDLNEACAEGERIVQVDFEAKIVLIESVEA